MTEVKTITDEEVSSLTQGILVRYGIDFTCYEPKSLRRRIVRLLNIYAFNSIHELWTKILKDRTFIYVFINEVSVGMTSMFRDPIFWRHLKRLLSKNFTDSPHFRIWHAGCSTGEEVYSMGILLRETRLDARTSSLATDINQQSLEITSRGEYHSLMMAENEKNFKEYNPYGDFSKYYTRLDEKTIKFDVSLASNVKVQYHNLISDGFATTHDLILCRNVMIYFDNDARKKLLHKFYQALNPEGYFVIGFYDTILPMVDQKLFRLIDEEAKIFQKVG